MKYKWEGEIKDPNEKKVFNALSDPSWDFRTINGIKKSTGLSEDEIGSVINKYRHLIRESPVRDKKNGRLFTLIDKIHTFGEIINIIIGSISKST